MRQMEYNTIPSKLIGGILKIEVVENSSVSCNKKLGFKKECDYDKDYMNMTMTK